MKTKYQYITFTQLPSTGKTTKWLCINNSSGDPIGSVIWYYRWRQYVYEPGQETVYSAGCLEDIQDFMRQLKEIQVEKRNETMEFNERLDI